MASVHLTVKQEELEDLLITVRTITEKQTEVDQLIAQLVDKVINIDVVESTSKALGEFVEGETPKETEKTPDGDPSVKKSKCKKGPAPKTYTIGDKTYVGYKEISEEFDVSLTYISKLVADGRLNDLLKREKNTDKSDRYEPPVENNWSMLIIEEGGATHRFESLKALRRETFEKPITVQMRGITGIALDLFNVTTRKSPHAFPPDQFIAAIESSDEETLGLMFDRTKAGGGSFRELIMGIDHEN